MYNKLFSIFITIFVFIALPSQVSGVDSPVIYSPMSPIEKVMVVLGLKRVPPYTAIYSLNEVKKLLHNQAPTMSAGVIEEVLATLKCAKVNETEHNNILTVIDYSLPSSEKRLWVFDLKRKKLLFHTYVSHGIKSGALATNYFSNRHNSKATSLGVYKTEKAYYGRHGYSLRLAGLERGFNDNASSRAIVMHGGWYVDEKFIKKYGRAGRSWGCPAVSRELSNPIINTIKDESLFVAYYPHDQWILKSKFLNCGLSSHIPKAELKTNLVEPEENREEVLFALKNNHNIQTERDPIVAMSADDYQRIFHKKIPLKRMLRRQVNSMEYIALNQEEINQLTMEQEAPLSSRDNANLKAIHFIAPAVKNVRGYYATEMNVISYGKIKDITSNAASSETTNKNYTVHLEKGTVLHLKTTNQFIRWLGL